MYPLCKPAKGCIFKIIFLYGLHFHQGLPIHLYRESLLPLIVSCMHLSNVVEGPFFAEASLINNDKAE